MSGPCVHKDDIETEAIQKFMEADVIALVSRYIILRLRRSLKRLLTDFIREHTI